MEGTGMSATLVVDHGADAAYLQLGQEEIIETCEVSPGVLVDLNDMRIVVGVEVLTLDAYIPREKLIRDFHMRAEDLEVLDSIRPSVTTFVQRQSAPIGVASPQGVLETCA
jgi:uncharacterized protein YuzE